MLSLKIQIIILFTSILTALCFVYVAPKAGGTDNNADIIKLAQEMKIAVINRDVKAIIRHVNPRGMYFLDRFYTFDEVVRLIEDKDSWLYKHMFEESKSVRNYFIRAKGNKYIIQHMGKGWISIVYQSSNYERSEWIESCFYLVDKKWYFNSGIFDCGP